MSMTPFKETFYQAEALIMRVLNELTRSKNGPPSVTASTMDAVAVIRANEERAREDERLETVRWAVRTLTETKDVHAAVSEVKRELTRLEGAKKTYLLAPEVEMVDQIRPQICDEVKEMMKMNNPKRTTWLNDIRF